MSDKFFLITILLTLLGQTACQSVDSDSSTVRALEAGNQPSTLVCDQAQVPCEQENNPTVCTIDRVGKTVLPNWRLIKGWGDSKCEAQSDLLLRACQLGYDANELGKTTCTPDPSQGECTRLTQACPRGNEKKFCFTTHYDNRKLLPQQIIGAQGASECEAKERLNDLACTLNLKPSLIGEVACLDDRSAGECPVPIKSCAGGYFPFVCVGNLIGGVLQEKLSAKTYAENSCLAETSIKQVACNLNIPPSQVEGFQCFPDR